MERRATDTMPLPVVQTVAAPGPPTTVAMPVEPPPPLAPPAPRRDLTPWLLGLLVAPATTAVAPQPSRGKGKGGGKNKP